MVSSECDSAVLGIIVGDIGRGSDGRRCARHHEERFSDKGAAFAAAARMMQLGGYLSFYLRDESTGEQIGDLAVKASALVKQPSTFRSF